MPASEETGLVAAAPTSITTAAECQQAVYWLRAKAAFDRALDAAHDVAIRAAHTAHKMALKARDDLRKPSDKAKEQIRAMIEAYAENPAAELPSGVFRRRQYRIQVIDPAKVPSQYLIPDTKAIADFARRTEGSIPVPGVEIIPEVAVTVRTEGSDD